MACGLPFTGLGPPALNVRVALAVPGNNVLVLTLSLTGWLSPLFIVPEAGETMSQEAFEEAFHDSACTPGLLTVTTCPGGDAAPSVPVKETTAGVSWSTAS